MIGLGKWSCSVDTVFLKGEAVFEITDENGEYKFDLHIESDTDVPDFKIIEVNEEDGNTLKGKAEVSLLPGKPIELSCTFEGDTMTGYLKVPYIGKIKIKDGKKIG